MGKELETWIAGSYLGQGAQFLPGSRWRWKEDRGWKRLWSWIHPHCTGNENSIELLSCTWSKVWQERDWCRHYCLCGVFLRMLLVNVGLFWKLQQVWITTLITPSLHFHALADLLEDLGKLQCWWNNLVISRKRIFFWKLDRRNKIYLLEVHRFLLVEGDCRIFADSECSLNTLHWREVHFFQLKSKYVNIWPFPLLLVWTQKIFSYVAVIFFPEKQIPSLFLYKSFMPQ